MDNIEYSLYQSSLLQLGSIGGILGLIILFILTIHCLCIYCSTWNKENTETYQKGYLHILTLLYLITGIIICSFIVLARTNIVTRYQIHNFSEKQCSIGYYGSWLLSSINLVLFYWIIIKKSDIVFKLNAYKISSITIIFCYWSLAIKTALNLCILQLSQRNAYWSLIIDDANISIYCMRQTDNVSVLIYMLQGISILFGAGLQGLLLYLYVDRIGKLYDLYDRNNDEKVMKNEKLNGIILMMKKLGFLIVILIITTNVLLCLSVIIFNGIEPYIWICWEIIINSLSLWLHSRIVALFFYLSELEYHRQHITDHTLMPKETQTNTSYGTI